MGEFSFYSLCSSSLASASRHDNRAHVRILVASKQRLFPTQVSYQRGKGSSFEGDLSQEYSSSNTRELLRDYVLILANSGIRVGEANNLRESDLVKFTDGLGRQNYRFVVNGKTGEREVVRRHRKTGCRSVADH